jgi:hypothetical protein
MGSIHRPPCSRLPVPARVAEEVQVMHWKVGRVSCTFKVDLRRGWAMEETKKERRCLADLLDFPAQARRAQRFPLGGLSACFGI